jgi:hypothetical protein
MGCCAMLFTQPCDETHCRITVRHRRNDGDETAFLDVEFSLDGCGQGIDGHGKSV